MKQSLKGTYVGKTIVLDTPLDLPDGHRVTVVVDPAPITALARPDRGIEEGESVWAWIAQFKRDHPAPEAPPVDAKAAPAKHVDHCIYGMPVDEEATEALCGDVA